MGCNRRSNSGCYRAYVVTSLSREQIKQLKDVLSRRIDDYILRTYDDGPRTHLGASLIGHECGRYLWYTFRWCFREVHTPRMLRLFNRGHREEPRFIEWLRGAGLEVYDVAPQVLHYHGESDSYYFADSFDPGDGLVIDATDNEYHEALAAARGIKRKQYRIQAVRGHFGGSKDGRINKALEEFTKELGFELPPMLAEFKTNGTGAGFNKLKSDGVKIAKPQHYNQMCTYGAFYQYRYAIYMCINKNDDALYIEIVELDWNFAADNVRKAETIIDARTPPQKISANPAYLTCKICPALGVCHNSMTYAISCRSCAMSKPVDNAEWFCEQWNAIIPKDAIKAACAAYKEAR